MDTLKYFTRDEVAMHSSAQDIWVSFLGKVYDLTPLIKERKGKSEDILLKPILAAAGQDISHWFDPATKDVRTHIDEVTGMRVFYLPNGRFLDVPPNEPSSAWNSSVTQPWWQNLTYCIGHLSKKTRKIVIINMLTSQRTTIKVCSEDSLMAIQDRYMKFNSHASSYTWKYHGVPMNMDLTLQENGVHDDSSKFYNLNMDEDGYLPSLSIYFNDDLTEA